VQTRRSFLKKLATGAATIVTGLVAAKVAKALPDPDPLVLNYEKAVQDNLTLSAPLACQSTTCFGEVGWGEPSAWESELRALADSRCERARELTEAELDRYFVSLKAYRGGVWNEA